MSQKAAYIMINQAMCTNAAIAIAAVAFISVLARWLCLPRKSVTPEVEPTTFQLHLWEDVIGSLRLAESAACEDAGNGVNGASHGVGARLHVLSRARLRDVIASRASADDYCRSISDAFDVVALTSGEDAPREADFEDAMFAALQNVAALRETVYWRPVGVDYSEIGIPKDDQLDSEPPAASARSH